jgi:hypothetical protein
VKRNIPAEYLIDNETWDQERVAKEGGHEEMHLSIVGHDSRELDLREADWQALRVLFPDLGVNQLPGETTMFRLQLTHKLDYGSAE